MKDVYELLLANSLVAYLVVAGSLIIAISKGSFALFSARSQSRREFIEIWCNGSKEDDLWLEMSIRHLLGGYLPANVIRAIITLPFPSLKLTKVIGSWSYLNFDSQSNRLLWRKSWRRTLVFKWLERAGFSIGYVLFAWAAMHFAKFDAPLISSVFAAYFLLVGGLCLIKVIDLFAADSVIRMFDPASE